MANLPEKNITQVDEITSVPANSKLFVNANGEFRQATVNEVVKSSTVVTSAVENAINTAVEDGVNSHFKQTIGSPILLTDSAEGVLADFKAYGRSIQNGTPTPDSPIDIKSVADSGYFDGELVQGAYNGTTGKPVENTYYIRNKNSIPCKSSDTIKLLYADTQDKLRIFFYKADGTYISKSEVSNTDIIEATAPTDAYYFNFDIVQEISGLTPTNAKHITVTINGKYALIEKSKGKNKLDITKCKKIGSEIVTINDNTVTIKAGSNVYGIQFSNADVGLQVGHIYTLSSKTSGGATSGGYRLWYADDTLGTPVGANAKITVPAEVKYILYYIGSPYTGTTDITISEMQIEVGAVATDYEPYKEEVKYIPLNEPLRSSLDGSVTDVASLDKVTRKFAKIVIDGVNCKMGYANSNIAYLLLANLGTRAICSHFTYNSNHNIGDNTNANTYLASGEFAIRTTVHDRIYFKKSGLTTVDEWNTWLQANPITVIYELAEPITESIEPVDIVTYDNVTYLTASDNAEMELEYPTSKVAGIASIGYSKGRKAEYEVELLKAQLLELQTAMVNSL